MGSSRLTNCVRRAAKDGDLVDRAAPVVKVGRAAREATVRASARTGRMAGTKETRMRRPLRRTVVGRVALKPVVHKVDKMAANGRCLR